MCPVKGNALFVQKVTFEPLMDLKQKPLWDLEMLQKLPLLKVFFTKAIKTHNYFYCAVLFNYFHEKNIKR